MENFKKRFNEDGPIKISDAEFAWYQEWPGGENFDVMMLFWLNEDNAWEKRRLCLRDLLRQSFPYSGKQQEMNAYHRTNVSLGRLTANTEIRRDLKTVMRYRPQLRGEFLAEFLYNLEHEIYTIDERDAVDDLIFFLVQFLTEEVGRELWRYHSVVRSAPNKIRWALDLIDCGSVAQGWWIEELQKQVVMVVTEVIRKHHKDLEQFGQGCRKLYSYCIEGIDTVIVVRDFINNAMLLKKGSQYGAAKMAKVLDAELPEGLEFIDVEYLPSVLYLLGDEPKSALKLAKRYLMQPAIDTRKAWVESRELTVCACWILMLAKCCTPEDTDFVEVLEGMLQEIMQEKK